MLEHLDDPDDDPVVSHGTRLTRFQRELVVQTLREHGARYMARAIEAKIASPNVPREGVFDVADAFPAAVTALDHEDLDDENLLMSRAPLASS